MDHSHMDMNTDDLLDDFQALTLTFLDKGRTVYKKGKGPAVVVLHEMPGISPQVARFARRISSAGFTVFMPSLFGRDGAVPLVDEGAAVFQRVCISREFSIMARQGTSPIVNWLKELARFSTEDTGQAKVGAVGMCLTGNFALSMMLEPAVTAPVLCQPSLPLDDPAEIEMSAADAVAVARRLKEDDLTARAYRFEGDHFCQPARFAKYQRIFGSRFEARSIPDSAANPDTAPFFRAHIRTPHSIVTQNLIDKDGEPTRAVLDEIIEFLHLRLDP